jgi:hypothetical protein
MGQNKVELDTQLARIKVIHTQESGLFLLDNLTNVAVLYCRLSQPFVWIDSDVVAFAKILH